MTTRLRSVVKPRSSGSSRWGYAVVTRPRVAAGYRAVADRAACVTVGENGGVSDLEHLDVLVVGAGLSGIGAGYRLSTMSPSRTWAILEARDSLGGTWDLFRYPGVRSDSDMFTLGFPFEPWTDADAIADGPKILDYLRRDRPRSTASTERIRFGHRVVAADWSSDEARWTVKVERDGERDRADVPASSTSAAATTTTSGRTTPELPGPRDLRGPGRAPAVLAGGPRRDRPEGRRHRLRRHGRDARARARRGRRRRHDAPALADVDRVAAAPGPARATSCSGCSPDRLPGPCALQERPGTMAVYELSRRRPALMRIAAVARALRSRWDRPTSPTTSRPTLRPVGPAPLRRPRR